jgi:hypothetical protein
VKAIETVALDTTDHHLYFSKLGDRLGFISELIVRRGLISVYVEQNAATLKPLVAAVRHRLNF